MRLGVKPEAGTLVRRLLKEPHYGCVTKDKDRAQVVWPGPGDK